MRKVKNKTVLRKTAWAALRENKKKNAVILLAVLLTSLMFTTLFSVVVSMIKTSEMATMRQVGGKAMAGLKQMLPEDYEKIKNDPETVDVSYRISVGNAMNPELVAVPTEVNYATEENADNMFCLPTTGTMPKEKMDIVMSTRSLDKLKIPHKLGEKVKIDLQTGEETAAYEFTLCGFWEGDPVAMAQQAFVSREFCDEAAPTPKTPAGEETYDYSGYWMIDFSFKNSFDIEGKTMELLVRNGYDPQETMVGINWAYTFDSVDQMTFFIGAGIVILILLAGGLIIYNVFYINIVADIHSYGLLKTIGTTGRQLKKLVRYQAAFFSLAGIPLGLVFGTVTGKLLFPLVADTSTMEQNSYTFSVSPVIYLLAAVFTLLTVFISCSKPCRVAAKVSAVEAVSYNGQQETKKRAGRRKVHRFSVWNMAWTGLGRSKKKVFIVVLSLSLSLLLVNGIYTVVHSFDADKYVSHSIVGDISIQDASVRNFAAMNRNYAGVSEEDRAYFDSLDGVTQHSLYWMAAETRMPDSVRQKLKQLQKDGKIPSMYEEELSWYLDSGTMNGDVYGVDDFALDAMMVYDGEIDKRKFADGDYAVVYGSTIAAESEEDSRLDTHMPGESVEVTFTDGTKKSYEVMAVAELPYPLTTQTFSTVSETVCIPSADMLAHNEDQGALYSVLEVEEDQREQVEQALTDYTEQSVSLSCITKSLYLKEFDQFVRMIYLVGGSLAGVLAVIGIMNFINAVVTGMLARRREFAMMEAVGMTEKQLSAMMVCEGVCYVIFTMALVLALNFLAAEPVIHMLAGEIWFFSYQRTVMPLLACLPVMLVFSIIIPYASCRKMRKASVVERMRTAE